MNSLSTSSNGCRIVNGFGTGRGRTPSGRPGRRRNQRGTLAEFAPALMLLLALYLIPTLALLRLAFCYMTMSYCVSSAADSAGKSPTYTVAAHHAEATLRQLASFPLATSCGLSADRIEAVSVLVHEHEIATGLTNTFKPEKGLKRKISPTVNTYEYEVTATYNCPPFLSDTKLPLVKNIPALGAPFMVTISSLQTAEYPEGVNEQ